MHKAGLIEEIIDTTLEKEMESQKLTDEEVRSVAEEIVALDGGLELDAVEPPKRQIRARSGPVSAKGKSKRDAYKALLQRMGEPKARKSSTSSKEGEIHGE